MAIRPEPPDGQPPAHLQGQFDHYSAGVFSYVEGECRFAQEGSQLPGKRFICGRLIVGVQPGVSPHGMSDLLVAIEARVLRYHPHEQRPRLVIEVPEFAEGDALLVTLLDARVRAADLSWWGGTISE